MRKLIKNEIKYLGKIGKVISWERYLTYQLYFWLWTLMEKFSGQIYKYSKALRVYYYHKRSKYYIYRIENEGKD